MATLPRPSLLLLTPLLAVLAWPAPRARAYSKDNHERITRAAAALVDQCRSQPGLDGPKVGAQVDTLVELNRAQDGLSAKLRLWHFPSTPETAAETGEATNTAECKEPPCQEACPARLGFFCRRVVFKTFDPWVNELWAEIARGQSPERLYPGIGALLHYVQDLAVPAHAVPIFHPDPMLWFGGKDELDDYELSERPEELLPDDPCHGLTDATDVGSLLAGVRKDTLDSLETTFEAKRDGNTVSVPWREFWRGDQRNEDAPDYGSYGCSKDFGDEEVQCGDARYQIPVEVYTAYARERALAAVRWSARMIVLGQRHLRAPRQGEGTLTHMDPWIPSKDRLEAIPPSRRAALPAPAPTRREPAVAETAPNLDEPSAAPAPSPGDAPAAPASNKPAAAQATSKPAAATGKPAAASGKPAAAEEPDKPAVPARRRRDAAAAAAPKQK